MDNRGIYKLAVLIFTAFILAFGIFSLMRLIDEPVFRLLGPDLPIEEGKEDIVAPTPPLELSFVFGGDVMLSRQVGQRMAKYADYQWPFREIGPYLAEADLTLVNLESPFIFGQDYYVPTGSFTFRADPQAIAGLEGAGIDIVSLANNHFANAGRQGMADTFSSLEEVGIGYIGAGKNESEAREGIKREFGGHCFAFLAFAYPEDTSLADEDTAGIVGMDEEKAATDVARLKSDGCVVIVSMHAGIEYTREPNWQQEEFARGMIEAGADLIVGHHPHWPQTTEVYQGKLIIYSLGNLVFDQMWSLETRQGLLARVSWKEGVGFYQADFLPVKIFDYGQPQLMEDGEERSILLDSLGLPNDGHLYLLPDEADGQSDGDLVLDPLSSNFP